MDRVSPKFHQLGLEYECVGGGRIRHDSKNQKIHIYGYSVVRWSTSLVPRPLPDFISQLWRKIGRRPVINAMSQTGNGGLG